MTREAPCQCALTRTDWHLAGLRCALGATLSVISRAADSWRRARNRTAQSSGSRIGSERANRARIDLGKLKWMTGASLAGIAAIFLAVVVPWLVKVLGG
jgi:hypothetical protein